MNTRKRAAYGPVAGWLAGKVAGISGVHGGHGRAAVRRLARSDVTVSPAVLPRSWEATENRTASRRRRSWPPEGLTLQPSVVTGLADPEAAQHWIDRAVATNGYPDVLYNNAASVHFASVDEIIQVLNLVSI